MVDRWSRLERAAPVVGLVAFAAAFSLRRPGDFDLHWHLASGRQIAIERAIPRIDDLTYTHPSIRYTEFLSDLGLYAVMRVAGPLGLQLLGGVVAFAIGAVLWTRARVAGPLAPITTSFALLTMASWMIVRPATMSFLFFGLAILLIENHRREVGRPWQIGLLVPLQLVWCNVHQSATLGVALIVGYLVYRVVARLAGDRWPQFLPAQDGDDLRRVALIAVLATLATGANTAGFQYLAGAKYAGPMHELATEWAHVTLPFALMHEPFWLVLVACAILALVFGFGSDGNRAWPGLFEIGLALPALGISYFERFIPLTTVALAPMIAHRLAPVFRRLPFARALGAALPLVIAPFTPLRFENEVGVGLYGPHFPHAAVEFVRSAKPAGPMWNFSPFGGYIEWELYPAYRAFLDGRVLDMDIAQEARQGEFESAAFSDLANRFGITWAICRAASSEAFCLPIASNADWTMVFWDDVSAIYVKQEGPNAPLAAAGYRAFRHTLSFEQTLRRAIMGSSAERSAIAHDGQLAFAQATASPRAAFLGACGALAARDAQRFSKARGELARLAPHHAAIGLLGGAWTAAIERNPDSSPADPPGNHPTRVRRDSVRVPLSTGNPKEDFWQMHESEPLVVADDQPRPVTLLFHGMCADSSWTCDWLQYFDMAPQWQLCPRAPGKCADQEGYRWTGAPETRRLVELSIATLKERHDGRVREDATVLAGFSLGAYAVASLVHELALRPSSTFHVRGILAQGAHVHFAAADLRAFGARIALTAGDLDAAAPAMRAEAESLRREGVEARYVSLGEEESHFTSVSTGKTIAQLIDWCRGD